MFIAVREVDVRKKWNMNAVAAEAAKQLPARYAANLEKYQ
jgi:hypothetical protein